MAKTQTKKKPFSERDDVINKALLRSIKRFYVQEFRNDNDDLIKKRYKQVSASSIFNGFKKTSRRLFGDISNLNYIAQFIMIMSSVKAMNTYPFDQRVLAKAEQINNAMYKYSYTKFKKIFEIEEFEFIFRHILVNHRDRIFKLCTNKEIENKEVYNQMLEKWIEKFSEYSF